MSNGLKHNYVSEVDKFLQEFDQKNPQKSTAQQLEVGKNARIQQLRDQSGSLETTLPVEERALWEKF